jgi:hypothetical protein
MMPRGRRTPPGGWRNCGCRCQQGRWAHFCYPAAARASPRPGERHGDPADAPVREPAPGRAPGPAWDGRDGLQCNEEAVAGNRCHGGGGPRRRTGGGVFVARWRRGDWPVRGRGAGRVQPPGSHAGLRLRHRIAVSARRSPAAGRCCAEYQLAVGSCPGCGRVRRAPGDLRQQGQPDDLGSCFSGSGPSADRHWLGASRRAEPGDYRAQPVEWPFLGPHGLRFSRRPGSLPDR